jgi:hypothetical protein
MSVRLTSQLLDLPPAWLALLFQHVASGPGGLANAAALSQTCKFLHSLSEGPAVIYNNLFIAAVISSPDHPAWQWLAKRIGRIAGLSLDLRLELLDYYDATEGKYPLPDWMQPLQILSAIPSIQLRVDWVGSIRDRDHHFISQWLREHGHLISHLTADIDVSEDRLKLRQYCDAATPCRSIDLTLNQSYSQMVDLADLSPVASSLHKLRCRPFDSEWGSLRGASAFSSMSQLTALHLLQQDFCW